MNWFDPDKVLAEIAAAPQATAPQAFDTAVSAPAQPRENAELSGDDAERAAIIKQGAKVPSDWADGYARLLAMPQPANVTAERWQQFLNDAGAFLDTWAENAIAFGWASRDLFGIADNGTLAGHDLAMLLWILEGRDLVALTPDDAVIRESDGAVRKYRRDRSPQAQRIAWGLVP